MDRKTAIGLGFVVVCAVAMLGAVPAAASACSSFAGVKAFRGVASSYFDQQATGDDPGNGGTETVALERYLDSARVDLTTRLKTRHGFLFLGRATGGELTIDDTFRNTGTGQTGAERYSGPAFGSAELVVNTHSCRYQLVVGFDANTAFTGDREVEPTRNVAGVAYSVPRPIPGSLKLSRTNSPPTYYGCPGDLLRIGAPCYGFTGGFAVDFMLLYRCHSVGGAECSPSERVDTDTPFHWALSPVFTRHR